MRRLYVFLVILLLASGLARAVTVSGLTNSAPAIEPQLWRLLSWTSAGGTANDIRCAHSDITDDTTFGVAWAISYGMNQALIDANHPYGVLVSTEPVPTGNGQPDSYMVIGLKPNTTYYCAMKTDGGTVSASTTFATTKYEGYGYQSVGGGEGTFCPVSNVTTLRSCLGDDKYLVFTAEGSYDMGTTVVDARRNRITIDGATSPKLGVTLTTTQNLNDGFKLGGCSGTSPPCGAAGQRTDQILTYVRFKGLMKWDKTTACASKSGPPPGCPAGSSGEACDNCEDLLTLYSSGPLGKNIVVDHVTTLYASDSGADLSGELQDVTFSNSILAYAWHVQLVSGINGSGQTARVTLHHNLYANNEERNPLIDFQHTDMEFVNNIVWQYAYDPAGLTRTYPCCGFGTKISGPTSSGSNSHTDINIVNNYWFPFAPIGGATNNASKGLVYGSGSGWDTEEGANCLGGSNPGTVCTAGGGQCLGGGTCGNYSGCKKQGTVYTGAMTGDQIWTAGNVFPVSNCDEYSTVNQARAIVGAACGGSQCAAVTTGAASNLWATVLPGVGTLYRTTEEQTLIDSISLTLAGANLLVNADFETGAFGSAAVTGSIYKQNVSPCGTRCTDPVVKSTTTGGIVHTGSWSMKLVTSAICTDQLGAPPCGPARFDLTGLDTSRTYAFSGYYYAVNVPLSGTNKITLHQLNVAAGPDTVGQIVISGVGSWIHFVIYFQPIDTIGTYELLTTAGALDAVVYFDDLSLK